MRNQDHIGWQVAFGRSGKKNSLIFCLGDNSFSNYFKIERPSLAGLIRSVKSELHTQCRNYFSKTLLTSKQSFLIGGGRKNNSEITLKTDAVLSKD